MRTLLIVEFHIPILAQPALLQQLTLLLHDVLQGNALVPKDPQVVGNEMSILASRAGDESRALMIRLLRDVVATPF